jgi:hypothetical protein
LNEWIIVFIATFSNISAISWRPVLVVEEAGVPGENHSLKSRCFYEHVLTGTDQEFYFALQGIDMYAGK